MNEMELQAFRATLTEREVVKDKPIRARRYNVFALKNNVVIHSVEYVGRAKATQLRNEFRKQGFTVHISEEVTIGRNGKEIVFPERTAKEPVGHPAANGLMTAHRQQAKDARNAAKNLKRIAKQNGKTIRRSGDWSESASPFHQDYLMEVEKHGFSVFRNGTLVARGLRQEVAKAIFQYIEMGIAKSMNDFQIVVHGSKHPYGKGKGR
jgi:hypothetical protein